MRLLYWLVRGDIGSYSSLLVEIVLHIETLFPSVSNLQLKIHFFILTLIIMLFLRYKTGYQPKLFGTFLSQRFEPDNSLLYWIFILQCRLNINERELNKTRVRKITKVLLRK